MSNIMLIARLTNRLKIFDVATGALALFKGKGCQKLAACSCCPVGPLRLTGEDAFGNRDMASETLTDLTDRYLMQDKLGWKLSGWATKRAFPGFSGSSYESWVVPAGVPYALADRGRSCGQ